MFFVFRDSYVLCMYYEHSMFISHISNGYVTTREFAFILFIVLPRVFLTFKVAFWNLVVYFSVLFGFLGVFFCFSSGDCFDRVLFLFISRIWDCKYPGRVNCLWEPFAFRYCFFFLSLLCVLCGFVCVGVMSIYMFILSVLLCFSPL